MFSCSTASKQTGSDNSVAGPGIQAFVVVAEGCSKWLHIMVVVVAALPEAGLDDDVQPSTCYGIRARSYDSILGTA